MQKKVQFEGRDHVTSSFSGSGHSCVGVSIGKGDVSIVNTNTRDKCIQFTHEEWSAFVAGVKNSEFDL